MRQTLSATDRLVVRKNLEISELNSRLARKDETIAELGEEIDKLESELASREPTYPEPLVPVGTDLSKVEAADLLNQLKGKRKKTKAELGDMDAVLDLLSQLWRGYR